MKRAFGKPCPTHLFCRLQRACAKPFHAGTNPQRAISRRTRASKAGNRMAWTLDEQGKRNVWVAEGPDFKAGKLTNYTEDDGSELSSSASPPMATQSSICAVKARIPPGQYRIPPAIPQARKWRRGPWPGTAASQEKSTKVTQAQISSNG